MHSSIVGAISLCSHIVGKTYSGFAPHFMLGITKPTVSDRFLHLRRFAYEKNDDI